MFERFTAPARQMVVFAQDEARLLEHNYIGSEHLLLGLLRAEEGVAADVLKDLGVTLERVRDAVRIGGAGAEPTSGQLRFTPRAKKTLEIGTREALAFRDGYITTAHILLALTRVGESRAARILFGRRRRAHRRRDPALALHHGRELGRGHVGGTHSSGLDASRLDPRTA